MRIDAVDQAGAVGACDEIALCVPGQRADVRLVALEEQFGCCAGLGGIDAVDRSGIAGGDVEASGGIEGQIPDVVRLRALRRGGGLAVAGRGAVRFGRVKDDRRIRFIQLSRRVGVELVDFAAWHCCCVQRAIGPESQSLNAEVLGLEEREWLFAGLLAKAQHRCR